MNMKMRGINLINGASEVGKLICGHLKIRIAYIRELVTHHRQE
jgi:hypothetical protein